MKIIGMLVLLFSGCACAFTYSNQLNATLNNARALCELLRVTSEFVDRFSMPASEILRNCSPDLLRACGYSDGEESCEIKDFFELGQKILVIDVECRRIFCDFCSEFGRYYRAYQAERCKKCLAALEARTQEISATLPNKKRSGTALFLCAALMLAILLA